MTPAKRESALGEEEPAESPTDSKPHGGPVFLHRPPTPGKDIINGATLLQPHSFHSSLANPKVQKQKPPGYLGASAGATSRPDLRQRSAGYMGGLPRPRGNGGETFVAGLQAN